MLLLYVICGGLGCFWLYRKGKGKGTGRGSTDRSSGIGTGKVEHVAGDRVCRLKCFSHIVGDYIENTRNP